MPIGQNAGREDAPKMCTTAIAMYTIFNARPVTPLRRLERYRPDILDRVLAREISAHAGVVEAAFRKRRPRP